MSLGTERLTGNTNIAYPFHDDTAALEPYTWMSRFVVDAYIEAHDGVTATLSSILVTSSLITLTVHVSDHYIPLTLSVAQAGIKVPAYTVLSYQDSLETVHLKLVVHNENALTVMQDPLQTYHASYTCDPEIPFASCVVDQQPRGLVDIHGDADGYFVPNAFGPPTFYTYALQNPPEDKQAFTLTGRSRLAVGFNTAMTITPTNNDTTEIAISASPGAGLGRVDCTTMGAVLSTKLPLGLQPDDNGNIQVETDGDCYTARLIQSTGQLILTNDCSSCCDCDDYVAVLAALKRLATQFVTMKALAMHSYDQHQLGVLHFNEYAVNRPTMQLTLEGQRGDDYSINFGDAMARTGAPNRVRWIMGLSNTYARGTAPVVLKSFDIVVTEPAVSARSLCVVEYHIIAETTTKGVTIDLDTPVWPEIRIFPGSSISANVVSRVPLGGWAGRWAATATAVVLTPTGEQTITAKAEVT